MRKLSVPTLKSVGGGNIVLNVSASSYSFDAILHFRSIAYLGMESKTSIPFSLAHTAFVGVLTGTRRSEGKHSVRRKSVVNSLTLSVPCAPDVLWSARNTLEKEWSTYSRSFALRRAAIDTPTSDLRAQGYRSSVPSMPGRAW